MSCWPRLILCGLLGLLVPPLHGQLDRAKKKEVAQAARRYPTQVLEVVVVEADAPQRTPLTYGGTRTLLGPDAVRRLGTDLLEDLVRRTPGAFVFTETGTDSKPNIALRGLNPERSIEVSLLADGVPLAPAPYGYPGMSLHPFLLPRLHALDVIRSGYTVRYGPNNVAGIVNYLTRPIPDRPRVEQVLRGGRFRALTEYTGVGGSLGPVGAWVETVYQAGATHRRHGDFELKNTAGKFQFQPAENLRLLLQVERFSDHSDMAGGLSAAAYRADPEGTQAPLDRFRGFADRLMTRLTWDLTDAARFEVLAYTYDTERTFYLGQPNQYTRLPKQFDRNPDTTAVTGIQPQVTLRHEVLGLPQTFLAGFRFLKERIHYRRLRQNPYPTGPWAFRQHRHGRYRAWAFFVEDRVALTDRLSFLPGLRVENVNMDVADLKTNVRNRENFLEFLPAASLTYRLREDWALYAACQRSFRAPAIFHFSTRPGVPQDLEAERAWTYEAGTRADLFGGGLWFDLDYYYLDFRNRIVKDTSRPEGYVNQGKVVHHGLELAVEAKLASFLPVPKGLELYGTFHTVNARIRSGPNRGNRSANAPPYGATWGLAYRPETGFWASLDGFWVARAWSDNENTRTPSADGTRGPQPAHTVWAAHVGYRRPFVGNRLHLNLEGGVLNLFNRRYFFRRRGKGILPAPPRRWYGALTLTLEL